MVAVGDAAGHLHVDQPVTQAVAPHQLAQDEAQRRPRHRPVDAQLTERAVEPVDVRIISSTSRDLEREIAEGRFREDLYHRLNVVPLRVPGLAERREDIPDLIQYFVGQLSSASGLAPRRIGEDAIAVLQAHDWPGNVRELRNNIERLMILAGGDPSTVITAEMLPEEIGSNVPLPVNGGAEHLMSLPLREAREIFEREYLLAQINRFGGNISRTAEFVGMERSALHRKLRALGVSSEHRTAEIRQA